MKKRNLKKALTISTVSTLSLLTIGAIFSPNAYAVERYDIYNDNKDQKLQPQNSTNNMDRVNAIINKYKANNNTAPDVIDQVYVLKNGQTVYSNTPNNGLFYLASTGKTIIMDELADVLKEQNLKYRSRIVSLNRSNINEAINSGRIITMPSLFILRAGELGLSASTRADIVKYSKNPGSFSQQQLNTLIGKISTEFAAYSAFNGLSVSFVELGEMNLRASLNSTVSTARNYIVAYYYYKSIGQSLPNPIPTLSESQYRTGFDILITEVQKKVPGYEITNTYGYYDLWLQESPNAASTEKFAQFYDSLFLDNRKNDPFTKVITTSVANNPYSFGFDTTTPFKSAFPGTKIYEKTGLYPAVYWVNNLADAGYPVHLSMSSIFSFKKNNDRYTIVLAKSVKVPLPPNGSDGLPNEYDATYNANEIAPRQAQYFPQFRQQAINLVNTYAN